MHSCLYEGSVRHRRCAPMEHGFEYRLFLLYLDLSEIDEVFAGRWFWSARRIAPARFRREDHLGDPSRPLDGEVRRLVAQRTGRRPSGPIRLLTHLRYFGYLINPVSFYFCFEPDGQTIAAVVAEVNNTPWGERYCYVIPGGPREADDEQSPIRFEHAKEFHVSPFLPMSMQYRWRVGAPGNRLSIHIANFRDDCEEFQASLNLARKSLTTWQLTWMLVRYPLMTLQVALAIYWQALRLWWKGAKFLPYPRNSAPAGSADDALDIGLNERTGNTQENGTKEKALV